MHTTLQTKERDLHNEVVALKIQPILESDCFDKRKFFEAVCDHKNL